MYPCPQNPSERKEMATGVLKRVEDLNRVRTTIGRFNYMSSMIYRDRSYAGAIGPCVVIISATSYP